MKYLKPLIILLLVSVLLGVATIASFYIYLKPQLPSVDVLKDVHLQTPMKIYSQDGKLISQFGVKRRIPLSIDQIPPQLINAVLATEDSRFYDHPGIDIIGVFRAAVNLITTGEKGQGASTITMQLARGFFLTREKAYIRKIKEIFIAWHIEQVLTKNEILELYMNKIELGHRAFGFGAAAQVYYGKEVSELNLAQIATLAGLPQAPSVLNPISRPDRSKARRRLVLLRMLDENYINREQYNQAVAEPVTAKPHGAEIELHAPYIADMAYNEMIQRYGKEEAETRGLSVYLTIPSDLQTDAQQAVIRNLHDYDERHGYRGPIRQLWEVPESSPAAEQEQPLSPVDNITTLADPAWSEEQMLQELASQIAYAPLSPAIVTRTFERAIEVFTAEGEYINIDWDGIAWARAFINDSRQGPDPQVATDIVKAGAMVYIRKRDDDPNQWQLSQFPDVSGAFVALNPENGAIQALVGGYSFYQSQFNRATQAKRQVGSNIKPFVYSAALDAGYTLASVINDAPINQSDRDSGIAWRPKNSDGKYDGPIRMRVGLGKSKNMVSIRLLRGVGLDNVINHLARFGFNPKELPHDETLAIGSASLTPMEVATGFAIINNGGYAVEPYLIDRIEDLEKLDIWQANPMVACRSCRNKTQEPTSEQPQLGEDDSDTPPLRLAPQVLDSQNAFLVTDMMRTGLRANGSWTYKTYWQGTGWRARNILHREDLAGKTGTTNDAKDTWFSGFTPDLVATAWVGFDDMSRSLGRTSANQYLLNKNPEKYNWLGNAMVGGEDGARAAQPAWIRFMQKALQDVPEKPFYIPQDIVTVRIDRTTGKLTQRTDHTSRFEYFKKGTEPTQYVREDELVDPYLEEQGQTQQEPEDIF